MALAPDGTPVLRLDGLTKRYGRRRGVEDISLEVPRGQVLGFLGPNGAGKSTTIRLIMGLSRPTAGEVEVFGLSPRRGVQLRRQVGYLPGELVLFPRLTGRDLIGRVARIHGGVDGDDIDHLVARLHAELDRPLRALSKGNRQKIGVVLAFMHRPELLVLDEPTSGLDPLLQDEFAELVREQVGRARTVFLSSHDLDEVDRIVDRVAIIRQGRLAGVDTVSRMRERAPRLVELRFDFPAEPSSLVALPGVSLLARTATSLRLEVRGPLGPLLEAALPLGVADLVAPPPGLDEIFRSFYEDEDELSEVGRVS